jgi:membrane-bound serine protease (ClpP class)
VGGLILILFGIVLIGLELTVTSHGLLGFGGVVCLAIGASALYRPPVDPFAPFLQVAPLLVLVVTLTAGAFVGLIAFAAVRSRGMRAPAGGIGSPIPAGTAGVVRRPLEPIGSIFAGGEEWTAKSADGHPLERGTPVKVVGTAGLTLIVELDRSPSSS